MAEIEKSGGSGVKMGGGRKSKLGKSAGFCTDYAVQVLTDTPLN
jgi:hypothetical protein